MRKINIIAVGKNKSGPLHDLCTEYIKRLNWPVTLTEIDSPRHEHPAVKEAALILKQLPDNALVVAMDEKGKEMSSVAFSGKIETWTESGRPLFFLIGGADGFYKSIRSRADFLISFGKQTWPHMLVRVMLLEQIYRAQQILAGHPYHRA